MTTFPPLIATFEKSSPHGSSPRYTILSREMVAMP